MRLLLAAALLILPTYSFSHDAPSGWRYDQSCCSGVDCRPIHGDVKLTPGGYQVPSGEIIPYKSSKVRPSGDGDYHWCTKYGKDDTPTLCIYAPTQGF